MNWMKIEDLAAQSPLPAGYRYAQLNRAEIPALMDFLTKWFPEVAVGAASCYLRESFYHKRVFLEGESEKDVIVLLVKKQQEIVAMFSAERDQDTLVLYGRLGVVAEAHRGMHLCESVIALTETIGRSMGMGMAFGMATLHIPYMQIALEKLGFQLVGITPGYDREVIAPGVVKRVFEAIYAKSLVDTGDLLFPKPENLTPKTKALFDSLFSTSPVAHG